MYNPPPQPTQQQQQQQQQQHPNITGNCSFVSFALLSDLHVTYNISKHS